MQFIGRVAKSMKPNPLLLLSLVTVQAILFSGCATRELWQTGRFANFHEPATPSNLRLFQSTNSQDVLVQYDECRENDDRVRRRAYWLEHNSDRVRERQKPRFVSFKPEACLIDIPVSEAAFSADSGTGPVYALASTNNQSFTLYSSGRQKGPYELPVYPDASGRTKQVILTPFTVAADLTVVGGYLFVIAWECGGLQWALAR